MTNPRQLQSTSGVLKTRMGACFPGSRAVFRGCDLHADLREMDWMELLVFGITGRRFSPAQIELLHAIWVYTSYPDARLWNNRVAALAGTARSTPALGISAALAVSEAAIYGGQAGVRAIEFFLRIQQRVNQGDDLETLVKTEARERRVLGYGRPIDAIDERIPWLLKLAERLGLAQGPHVALAFEVEKILLSIHTRLHMNYAAITAALCADLGFSVLEFHMFRVPMFLAGMPPCYLEARENNEGALFPLSCDDIHYEGTDPRRWDDVTEEKNQELK